MGGDHRRWVTVWVCERNLFSNTGFWAQAGRMRFPFAETLVYSLKQRGQDVEISETGDEIPTRTPKLASWQDRP